MPWNYTNTEFLNAVKSLKTDFLNRLRLDPEASPEDKIKHTVFKDEDLTVRIKCINFVN